MKEKYMKTKNKSIECEETNQISDDKFGFYLSNDSEDLEFNMKKLEANEQANFLENDQNKNENIPNNTEEKKEETLIEEKDTNDVFEYQPNETNVKKKIFTLPEYSPFFVINLVFLDKIQGFQKLLQLIHNSHSASQIISVLDFFENLWIFFEKDYLMANLSQVLEDIKLVPQKINEDEIKNSKKTEISDLLHTIEVHFI